MFVLKMKDKLTGKQEYFVKGSSISCGNLCRWPDKTCLFESEEDAIKYTEYLLSAGSLAHDIQHYDFEPVKTICLDFGQFGIEYCTPNYLAEHPRFKDNVAEEK